ncbi:TPA: carbohydrate ABC transporter permease [Streptococcus suis]|nr:carbohydrate ABC transporter permease [Streptococcus suis]HEM2729510.1 carbohydrate ABC transporter permease [Streptococcus suis]
MKKQKFWQQAPSDILLDIGVVIFLLFIFFVTVYPFWNILVVSLNDAQDSLKGNLFFWPRIWSFASYQKILENKEFINSIYVTIARTTIGTPLSVLITAMAAYTVSRKEFSANKFVNLFFIFTMYFSGGLVPYYMIIKTLGLTDNFLVYIIPGAMGVYNMILIRSYIDTIPEDLYESAKLDGANDLTIFFKIILPISKPILMTVALFVAVSQWNSWFDAYLFTSSQSLKPMQSILVEILNQYQTGDSQSAQMSAAAAGTSITPDSLRMAATIISSVPIIVLYPFVQKYFIKGMMIGAVKS